MKTVNIRKMVLRAATKISPSFNDSLRYWYHYKRFPNRKDPRSFEEKLLVLKERNYNQNPLVVECADKYRVRDYVTRMGCGDCLNQLYAVYGINDSIEWDKLPNSFAMKLNTGAGFVHICHNKSIELKQCKALVSQWKDYDHVWLSSGEMHYEAISPRIVFEKVLDLSQMDDAEDYKVYCFNGEPKAVLVISDRHSAEGWNIYFMSTDWDYLGMPEKFNESQPRRLARKPTCLDEMLEIAKDLSQPFPFVRIDFYVVDNRPVFGEMTFTPRSCIMVHEIDLDGTSMGSLLGDVC